MTIELAPGSGQSDVRLACALAAGVDRSDVRIVAIAPPLRSTIDHEAGAATVSVSNDTSEQAVTPADVPATEHDAGKPRLSTDMPEASWPTNLRDVKRLIRLAQDRRWRADQRQDQATRERMDVMLRELRARRDALKRVS
jgi:hypothetical protein